MAKKALDTPKLTNDEYKDLITTLSCLQKSTIPLGKIRLSVCIRLDDGRHIPSYKCSNPYDKYFHPYFTIRNVDSDNKLLEVGIYDHDCQTEFFKQIEKYIDVWTPSVDLFPLAKALLEKFLWSKLSGIQSS